MHNRVTLRNQRGMSPANVMLILVLIGFFALMVIRLAPLYMENFSVKDSLKSLHDDSKARSVKGIKEALVKRFQINQIDRVKPENILIQSKGGGFEVEIKYEARVHFAGNLDFVAMFDDTAEVPGR